MLSGWLPEAVVSHGFLGRERLPEMDAASRLVLAITRKLP